MTRQMASWRLRGYVPDSDQEDSDEENLSEEKELEEGYQGRFRVCSQIAPAKEVRAVEVRIPQKEASQSATENRVDSDGARELCLPLDREIDELQDPLYDIKTAERILEPATRRTGGEDTDGTDWLQPPDNVGNAKENTIKERSPRSQEAAVKVAEPDTALPDLAETALGDIAAPSQREALSLSPLSDLSTTPEIGSDIERDIEGGVDEARESIQLPLVVSTDQSGRDLELHSIATNRTGRSFRQRKAIQLHPYLIESEKYRKAFHERGVRALRIAQQESQQHADEDLQAQEFFASQASRSSSVPHGSVASARTSHGGSENNTDDELPDMQALLNQQDTHFVSAGHKRQRLDGPRFKRPKGLLKRQHAEAGATYLGDGRKLASEGMHNRIFPSPPTSLASNDKPETMDAGLSLRKSLSSTPSVLPTPVTSSEPRAHGNLEIWDAESTDSEVLSHTERVDSADEAPSQAVDSYRKVKNRIKGVLPASWLKLDLQAQTTTSKKRSSKLLSPSPRKRDPVRGVAQPVSRQGNYRRSTDRVDVYIVSDNEASTESDNEDEDAPRDRHENIIPDTIDYSIPDDARRGEAEEVQEVDAMLPTSTRPFRRRKSRKRQTRISDFEPPQSLAFLSVKNPQGGGNPAAMAKYVKSKSKPPVPNVPELSVLDAVSAPGKGMDGTQPPFLRIASRVARSRRDKGRHSPSRKFLKLATHQDTVDANQALRKWRQGAIKPTVMPQNPQREFRKPLLPRSTNSVDWSGPSTRLPAWQASTKELPSEQKNLQQKRKRQTALDKIFPVTEASRRLRPPSNHVSTKKIKTPHQTDSYAFQTSMQSASNSRPAMLEIAQHEVDTIESRHGLTRHLLSVHELDVDGQHLTAGWNGVRGISPPKPTKSTGDAPTLLNDSAYPQERPKAHAARGKVSRKRKPRRFDLSTTWQEDIAVNASPSPPQTATTEAYVLSHSPHQKLLGLGRYGTTYPATFDLVPFPTGTCFHEQSFLGSGQFQKCLDVQTQAFDTPRGATVFTLASRHFHWSAWDEQLSSDMSDLCEKALDACATSSILDRLHLRTDLLRQCAIHLSDHLYFYDPVDRSAYIVRSLSIVKELLGAESSPTYNEQTESVEIAHRLKKAQAQLRAILTTFASQIFQLAHDRTTSIATREDAQQVLSSAYSGLIDIIFSNIDDLEDLIRRFRHSRHGSLALNNENVAEACVIASHILCRHGEIQKLDQQLRAERMSMATGGDGPHVEKLEKAWRDVFHLQPFIEFDESGVLKPGRRFRVKLDSWTAIKALISPVLTIYLSNIEGQPASFNVYCRAIFNRCLYLISSWGWYKFEPIISTCFDFFSGNKLYSLSNEESHGSPSFLDHLSDKLSLSVAAEDRSFHIFLKIVGAGIRHLAPLYPEKKLANIIWRLLPNHGRSHPKEESVRQADLEALRNHHDLLCTLYWAAPANLRPKTSTIRNLVDVETSHSRSIHISIKAWRVLLRYQISTSEPVESLAPFVDWFNELLRQILRQHGLARSEAEEQVRSAQHLQGVHIPSHVLESTVSTNQRQIEALITDLVASLTNALENAPTRSVIDAIFATTLTNIFSILNVSRSHTCGPVIEALGTIETYVQWISRPKIHQAGSSFDEDSQEYGGWIQFPIDEMDIDMEPTKSSPLDDVCEPLHGLLSNCFGADSAPPDELLHKVVDTWAAVSDSLVRAGTKTWSDYVGLYHKDSWVSLRDTAQTKKYTAYYLAKLLERDAAIYTRERTNFLRFFFESLVERESLLKYQHALTSALLNIQGGDPLLANLPFHATGREQLYNITAREFSERRLSLISSLLANIRQSLELNSWERAAAAVQRKQEYRELINSMMHKMKLNFIELGPASTSSGAYVDFVHNVIGFLQQYTVNICPVNAFFTDDASFPLPAADPNYVVGRLKNYELRIQDPRAQKELVTFIQSVAERAAADNQQAYLASQIYGAISSAFEKGRDHLTLRSFMMTTVFPVYAEIAMRTSCGWVLCLPFLQAITRDLDEILLHLDGCSTASIEAVAIIVSAFLSASQNAMLDICWRPALLQQAWCLKTIRAFYDAAHALFPVLKYLTRLEDPSADSTRVSMRGIKDLVTFANSVTPMLSSADGASMLFLQRLEPIQSASPFPAVKAFATDELKSTIDRNWSCVHDTYYVKRGNGKKEIAVDIGLFEEERHDLQQMLKRFIGDLSLLGHFVDEEGLSEPEEVDPRDAWYGVKEEEGPLLF